MLPPFQRITVEAAADRLGRSPATIHCWGTRYNARKVRIRGSARTFYDYRDLAVIEREVRHGHPVPATPEERAAISKRCPLRSAERLAEAA